MSTTDITKKFDATSGYPLMNYQHPFQPVIDIFSTQKLA